MRLKKATRLCTGIMLLGLLSMWSMSAVQQAFAWGSPIDLPLDGVGCESTNCNIFTPRVSGEGSYFHLIYGQKDSAKLFYNRGIADASGKVTWESARAIANNIDTGGNNSWDIIADPNGTIHAAYYSNGSLYYIKNAREGAFGNWTSPERIDAPNKRAYGLAITLDSEGTPYVAWGSGIDKGGLRFAYRNSDGSWNAQDSGIKAYFVRFPDIAVSGGGASAVIHVMAEVEPSKADGAYSIYYMRAPRGGTIANSDFSSAFNDDPSNNRPVLTVDRSSNIVYASFVAGNASDGFYTNLTSSKDQGASWSQGAKANLGSGFWSDLTPMVASAGTVYMMLPGKKVSGVDVTKIGLYDVRYNAASNTFSSPVPILDVNNSDRKVSRDVDYGLNKVAKLGVWIRNYTDGPGYNSDPGGIDPGSSTPPATPVPTGPGGELSINNGASTTANPTVTINVTDVSGSPTKMRVAVDTAMSDAIPLETFQASFTRTFTNLSICNHTVLVTLVNDDGASTSTPLQASITVDAAVQANVTIGNPYKRGNAAIYSQLQDSTTQGASDGDAHYTRVPGYYAEVNGIAECGSLKQVSVGRTANSYTSTRQITGNFYASAEYLPGDSLIGPNNVVLQVQDNAGNTQVYSRTIYYDPKPPTIATTGTLAVQAPTSGPSVLTTLVFSGNVVTDNMYQWSSQTGTTGVSLSSDKAVTDTVYTNGFWGVWIANSRTPVTNPISDTNLVWSTVQRPDGNANFSLKNWSVLSGIPTASQTPGNYYVYVRFLDGAGNPTNGVISSTVTLNQVTKPTLRLPIVVR